MTDYYSQTVVRTDIPRSAMTGLEFDVLCQIFSHEAAGDDIYFFAEHGLNDIAYVTAGAARAFAEADLGIASMLADHVAEAVGKLPDGEEQVEIDVTEIGYETIFQDIVRRSALDFIEVETAWTCTKMRPDGFGGAATLITADAIEGMSTSSWLDEAIARLESGPAPG
jgi:hypothetical protein